MKTPRIGFLEKTLIESLLRSPSFKLNKNSFCMVVFVELKGKKKKWTARRGKEKVREFWLESEKEEQECQDLKEANGVQEVQGTQRLCFSCPFGLPVFGAGSSGFSLCTGCGHIRHPHFSPTSRCCCCNIRQDGDRHRGRPAKITRKN